MQVDFRLDAGLPPVLVDRIQIQQVLHNLLRNAVEALVSEAQPGGDQPGGEQPGGDQPGETLGGNGDAGHRRFWFRPCGSVPNRRGDGRG